MGAFASVLLFYAFFLSPPGDFPAGLIITIEEGEPVGSVADLFHKQHVIRSPFWFKAFVFLFGGEKNVFAGDYYFKEPFSVITLAHKVTSDDHGLTPLRVTVPEGYSIFGVADLFTGRFGKFDKDEFLKIAPEGYLFPDTYFFLPNVRATEVVAVMKQNFSRKITALAPEIETFGEPLEDVVKMASIIETEARVMRTRQIISGILWKRLAIGMPLQVDVSFAYVNGKNSYELTTEDLDIDSPYNSYKYAGLPPTPIANPGLSALEAAVTPIETPYLYFLSDREGVMHYARTFEEHKQNRRLYLGK